MMNAAKHDCTLVIWDVLWGIIAASMLRMGNIHVGITTSFTSHPNRHIQLCLLYAPFPILEDFILALLMRYETYYWLDKHF